MDYSQLSYNPLVESIVEILRTKTQNSNPTFFRLQTNYFLSLVPSMLDIKINSPITGEIPINIYAISTAVSGSGKGFSTNLLEEQVINEFREHFMYEVFPKHAQSKLDLEAIKRAQYLGISQQEAEERLQKEFKSYGAYMFALAEATSPAIKQMRNKIILAKAGCINMIVDECGFNFDKVIDALKDFLELYDKGLIKNKLTKNTDTSTRFQELVGKTPTNLLMFGTPSKLLDGGATEDKFFEFLESGYARRSFFASAPKESSIADFTPEELYKRLTASTQEQEIKKISRKLLVLCQPQLIGSIIEVPESVGIELLKYRIDCENRAKELPDHKEVYRAELSHRYFKALKLAGAYCFLRGSLQMSIDDLHQAICFAEDSGEALRQMLEREKPYERLAKYIGSLNGKEITQVDLTTNLPFYKGSNASKNEMMNMAIAYGYINNILIKKTFRDGVELFTGESLQETNLEKIICAYSDDFANGYENVEVDWFKDFDTLLPEAGFNWTNHHCIDGHRAEKDMIEGFNCIVLDVDGGISLQTVQNLLKDYEYIIHTTKRHQVTDEHGNCNDRFRIIIPTNYILKLDSDEFKQFMKNVAQWCPFELDEQTFQRSRKWACYEHTTILKNNGELFDVLPFIPRTSREAEYKKSQVTLQNLTAIERWFANRMAIGDRNNTLAKYGFMLLDNGFTPVEILDKLTQFNSKLDNPLDVSEIETTIIQSINNRYKEM